MPRNYGCSSRGWGLFREVFGGETTRLRYRTQKSKIKVALHFSGANFVSLNFIDYVSMALCMGDNRVGDTSDLLDLPQEVGLGRRGSF